MATSSVTYNFTNGVASDAEQVDQNFTDLVDFNNTNVVHRDGSTAMTGILTLPATTPTTDNHAVRKAYSDALPTIKRGTVSVPLVGASFVTGTVSFGSTFTAAPLVFLQVLLAGNYGVIAVVEAVTTTTFDWLWTTASGAAITATGTLNWMAFLDD